MKNKLIKLLTLCVILCLSLCAFTACGGNTENKIEFKTFSVNGTSVYGKVGNDTDTFTFIDEIKMVGNAKYIVSLDISGNQLVPTKTIPLTVGDNKVYITEMIEAEPTNVYEVTIRRKPLYSVTFNTDGGTEVQSQMIEEDNLVALPSENLGYTYVWDYDFATPITQDITIYGEMEIKEDIKMFNFNSTSTMCEITGVKDKAITIAVIPNYVTSIGGSAFSGCGSLTSIVIPDSVTSIGGYAFLSCSSLTSILIPNSVTIIGGYAFTGCSSLTSISVQENNAVYKSTNGDLYSKDGKTLIQYATGKDATTFTVPNSVTGLGKYAFNDCSSLTNIIIPSSVTIIGEGVFFGCSSLTNISVNNNNTAYKSINGNLYSKDGKTLIQYASGKDATTFTVPDDVISIGNYAFSLCVSLTSIIIPDSVTSMGEYAFSGCSKLADIYCQAESKPSGWSVDWNYKCPATVHWGYKG